MLEHMKPEEIHDILRSISTNYILVRIPVSKQDGGGYIYPVSNKDPTHITALTKESWRSLFKFDGYQELARINLPNIWDSEGVLCALYARLSNIL